MHVIGVGKDVMAVNQAIADRNRGNLKEKGVYAINFMGAIGSGKTALIESLTKKFADLRMAAIAGDVVSDLDAGRLKKTGIQVIGLNTGKECHLDAHLVEHALEKLDLEDIDMLFIENVGNLICPVDFDLGAQLKVTVVSVSEGDDTVEKHPEIFLISDAIVINKTDIAQAVDADPEKMKADALRINPNLRVFLTSVKKDDGVDEFTAWVRERMKDGE